MKHFKEQNLQFSVIAYLSQSTPARDLSSLTIF